MSSSGRVIKADQISPVSVSSFRPDDALAKIENEVALAQQKLNAERNSATAEVQAIYDKANAEGFRAGYDKGLQQGLAEQEAAYKARLTEEVNQRTDSLVRSLEAALTELASRPEQWVKGWEAQALEMVTSIAERVARKLVEADPQVITRTMHEILLMIARAPKMTIAVHPIDLQTLELQPEAWRDTIPKSAQVDIVGDPELTRGGCRVTTEHCSIDARIETQIEKLLREIVGPTSGDEESSAGSALG
jgi:flagellar assembly protein FliH